jgi:threonine/homoserine/homoserine lactone efflux protein
MILDAIISGIGIGLIISLFLIGPVFVTLLYTSVHRGFRAGVSFAGGIVVCDSLFFLLAYYGISQVENTDSLILIFSLLGSVALLMYGFRMWFKKDFRMRFTKPSSASLFGFAAKGFLLNGLNPFVFIYWLGIVGTMGIKYNFDPAYIYTFFASSMITIFCTDMMKSHLSSKLQKIIRLRVIFWMSKISAALLILGGIILLFRVFW